VKIQLETITTWGGDYYQAEVSSAMMRGMGITADKIRDAAESLVPKPPGAPYASGDLVRTIRARMSERKKSAYVIAGDKDMITQAHPRGIFYPHMVEFGTYESPAQPFMRPAVNARWTLNDAADQVRKAINKKRREAADTRTKQSTAASTQERGAGGQFI